MLLMMLTGRFGPLPASVGRRVRRATAAERLRWARRLVGARTLDEVMQSD